MAATPSVAVVGGGWAGLSAAIHLVEAGCRVVLVDAAPACGGRARGIVAPWQGWLADPVSAADGFAQEAIRPLAFDNGQHLVIGAYSMLLALLGRIGATEAGVFTRRPFRLDDGGELLIPGPGLGGLLRARGLPWSLRLALIRVLAGIALAREPAIGRADGRTVLQWSRDEGHPPGLLERFWRPLVISTMNTPIDQACAATFVRVLADSVAGTAGASDLLIPHGTLSTAFVEPALAWLAARKVVLRQGCDIRAIGCDGRADEGRPRAARLLAGREGAPLALDGDPLDFDGIVLATPPGNAARILGRSSALAVPPALIRDLEAFDYRPISTVYLGWPASGPGVDAARWNRLPAMTLLHDDGDAARFGQWLFRRPDQAGWRIGGVVISDSAAAMALTREQLARAVSDQLGEALGLPPAQAYAVFHDRRATIAAVTGRPRLAATAAGIDGLVLAGDYQYHRYPATLESALRSGAEAATALLAGLAE